MTKKIVVALGGNAILSDDPTDQAQMEALYQTAKHLVKLVQKGYQLIISHGNGPQVGNLLLQQAAADSVKNPALSLDSCVAMTQGSIGYWLQNALIKALRESGLHKEVATILTQVVVDSQDSAFEKPTKPIGPFYSIEEFNQLSEESTDTFIEDAGRGYRKVVPSPKPQDIVQTKIIQSLIQQDVITISAGGGGIPVISTEFGYQGVEAVIDKDFASAKLAELIDADELLILTGVDNVYVNFNQDNQEKLEKVNVDQLKQWIKEKQFAAGSMLPKVEASIQFVESNPRGKAVITSLENIESYLNGGSATIITKG